MRIRKELLLAMVILILSGCTIHHQARLYDLETGDVIIGESLIRGNRAINKFVLPSGEKCKGESISGGEGSVSWGNIYSFYYGSTNYSSVSIPLSQRGVSVNVCDRGTVIECEYIAKSYSIEGHGICRDNRGKYYRLMF